MTPDRTAADAGIHPATKLQVADGAVTLLRLYHHKYSQLLAEREANRPFSAKLRSGLARIARQGFRLHTYPREFVRGYRSTRTATFGRADVERIDAFVAEGRYDDAAAFGAALLPTKAGDKTFLETVLRVFAKVGALELQAHAVAAIRKLADTPALRRQARIIEGRLRETEPGWLPAVPTEVHLRETPPAGRVLHLLKASLPHRQSGYTMRSHYILDSQRAASLDPVAMSALGFPRQIGITDVLDMETVNGIPHHRLDVADPTELIKIYDAYLENYAEAAASRVADISPAVLHVHSGHHGYEPALVGLALARQFRLPMVYEVRGFFESSWSPDVAWNERGENYARRYATETWCMQEADAVVTLSESMRAEIIARGVSAAKVFVVPNGVDTQAFRPVPRSAALVDKLGLADTFTFGYVSNLDHYREGHETLIMAARQLRSRGIPATAVIIGDGSRREKLEALAELKGAADAVLFTGRVPHDEVLDYYRLLDVFVVPRIPERAARLVTPLKPFEAMAAGLPVVVSDLEALLEIVGDGERGRSFVAGDAKSLANALQALHGDPDLRAELAKRGLEWVTAERQWSANAQRYADIYAAVTAARR